MPLLFFGSERVFQAFALACACVFVETWPGKCENHEGIGHDGSWALQARSLGDGR